MSDAVLLSLALLAAVAGMASFSVANDIHWRQLFGERPQSAVVRATCQIFGAGLLGVSFAFCAVADPVSMAMLVWPMLLGVAAAVVAMFLTAMAHRRTSR